MRLINYTQTDIFKSKPALFKEKILARLHAAQPSAKFEFHDNNIKFTNAQTPTGVKSGYIKPNDVLIPQMVTMMDSISREVNAEIRKERIDILT